MVFVPNATFGVNVIARSLDLEPGDEILSGDHEYGACDNTWDFICGQTGAEYIRMPVDLPAGPPGALVDAIWAGVTNRTRLIFLSHISSTTALIFPIQEICRRARARGILTLIDGAHAPGQIPLDLSAVGADFYTGNCHKWLMSPKGAGFLYAAPEVQKLVKPLVVSWGYSRQPEISTGNEFIDSQQWLGTNDLSAYLSVPAAIAFVREHDWTQVRKACHTLLVGALAELEAGTDLSGIYSADDQFVQMASILLPEKLDAGAFKSELYDRYRIEVPVTSWRDRDLMRISIQGYNTELDVARLIEAVRAIL